MKGDLKGNFEGAGTATIPTADTPTTSVVFLTGDVSWHPRRGDLFGKTAIAYNTRSDDPSAGVFSELDTITGGTGSFEGAGGYLQLLGSAPTATGVGTGTYIGQVCAP